MIEHSTEHTFDYILVGGGLQSGLIVMAVRHHQPNASVLVIEQQRQLAGNHTWSFHPNDVPASARPWVTPLIEYQWAGYDVRLNDFRRRLDLAYASISSSYFAEVITRQFPARQLVATTHEPNVISMNDRSDGSPSAPVSADREFDGSCEGLLLGKTVTALSKNSVTVDSGEVYCGRLVVDCRGPNHRGPTIFARCGYQKFWGFEIESEVDWPSLEPTVMDDAVDQTDGFRFIYSLPFERRRILVEDTRFSNSPALDRSECYAKVTAYLNTLGIKRWKIIREESGVLPMPVSSELLPGCIDSHAKDSIAGGYAGGWFHAATGYSFPLAVAFAETIATSSPDTSSQAIDALAARHRSRSQFGRFLNRLLFCLVKPKTRHQIFRRFYSVLSNKAIARFYSHQFTVKDAAKIVIGVPPRGLRLIQFLKSFFGTTSFDMYKSSTGSPASILRSEKAS